MTATASLPVEGELPDLGGATAWLNSAPLTPAGLRGKVVVVQFCTFSCINWLRTLPYVKAWAAKYRDDGLVVIGAHSPEFPFEHDLEKIRSALDGMGVDYPIAVDNDFAVWRAFDNAYWPALYFVDAGDGSGTTTSARRTTSGRSGSSSSCSPKRAATTSTRTWWRSSRTASTSPPTGTRWARRRPTSATPGPPASPHRAASGPTAAGSTSSRARLALNQWALSGDWTVGRRSRP